MFAMSHEFDLIAQIRRGVPSSRRLKVGIGDDAAVIDWSVHPDCLVTVDMLMEGVDFTFDTATPEQIGRKALAVNLSDIAAMAGRPVACVVAVALPREGGFELGQRLSAGLQALAAEFDVALAGGDTNTWNGPLVLSITVLGEPTGRGPVLRSGARPGDWICVTGPLGGSLLGHHLDFTPRVREAQALHQATTLHSLIDISDGLAADLGHILDESRVGALLDAPEIPISPAARELSQRDGRSPLDHALADGEDFELIFTLPPQEGARLVANPPAGVAVYRIGEITAEPRRELRMADGTTGLLSDRGWKHQFGNS
jgi:thiamine-monophosphate kinase